MEGALQMLATRLSTARRVVVLTGAGVSAESGLRTFRGATKEDLPPDMRTLWAEFDPATLATPEAFAADPEKVTRWYDWRRIGCLAAEPNPGHLALAEMERKIVARGGEFSLFTQNVDRLHQRAGSTRVFELHGSIIDWRCTETGRKFTPPEERMPHYPAKSPFHPGGLLRPDVVWFGEQLPEDVLLEAMTRSRSCDVFISVGTSAVVYPAAGFVSLASAEGAFTAEVNLEATANSRAVDAAIAGRSGDLLPRVVRAAFGRDS